MEEKRNVWISVSIILAILLIAMVYAFYGSYTKYKNVSETTKLYCNSLNYFMNDTSNVPSEITNRFVSGVTTSINLSCPETESFWKYFLGRF